MGGGDTTKNELKIGGTNYVVYQQLKINNAKQLWMNVNGIDVHMAGFQAQQRQPNGKYSGPAKDNGANPDISVAGEGLTAGIAANHVLEQGGDPTVGKDAPYYGISTMRASHQIWIPHKTQTSIKGTHTNTIKYVYEDGSPVLDANGKPLVVEQDLNLQRDLTLDLTQDQIQKIQDYAKDHNAGEILNYIRSGYSVTQDSNWQITDDQSQKVTDPYAAVKSPKLAGYTATIKSTNAPGVTIGANGDSVKANFTMDAANDVVQNGQLSAAYRNNGITGIPANYETVVVYGAPVPAEKGSVTVK